MSNDFVIFYLIAMFMWGGAMAHQLLCIIKITLDPTRARITNTLKVVPTT